MALKKTSGSVVIKQSITESGAATYTQERISLGLNTLDNEVFVVEALHIDPVAPKDLVMVGGKAAGTTTIQVATTSQSGIGLDASAILGYARAGLACEAFLAASLGAGFTTDVMATWSLDGGSLDSRGDGEPIGIIATPDFFIGILGSGSPDAQQGTVWMTGYRAKADAATYAALVQSELLSSA